MKLAEMAGSSKLSGFADGILGFAKSLPGVAIGITAVVTAIRLYNKHVEEQSKLAQQSYQSFQNNQSAITSYKSRIEELQSAIRSGNLSEEETIEKRAELISIQGEIRDNLGEEAAAFDVLTGSIDDATNALNNYSAAEAQSQLDQNVEAYARAVKNMEKEITAETTSAFEAFTVEGSKALGDVQRAFIEVFGADNFSVLDGVASVKGSATEIADNLELVRQKLHELESETGRDLTAELGYDWRNWINQLESDADAVIDKFGQDYDNYIQLRIVADTDYAKIEDQIAEAKSAYEKALASGDDKEMAEALAKVFSLSSITDDIDEKGVADYFNGVISALQDAASKDDAKIKLKADIELGDGNGKYGTIQRALKQFADDAGNISLLDITSAGQDAANIRAMGGELTGAAAAYTLLEAAAKSYGLEVDDLISVLVEQGVVQGEINDLSEEAVGPITALSEAYEKFDEITSTIDKLTEAHEKLADGSLELADVIDLIEEFPDLAEYVDLTADNFGNLDDGLRAVANDAPTALVDELRNFAETADLTDAQRKMILDLSDALASMPEASLDSLSSKYGELADEVSAAKRAVDELNSSLSEDTNTGYTTRAKAMEEMIDLMEHGAIGSESKLWSIADSFGLSDIIDFSNGVEAAADQLDELIRVRQRWYDGATEDGYSSEGIQNFVEDVSNMTGVLEQFDDVVWEFSEDGINIDIPSDQFEDFAHAIGMGTDELVDMLIQLGQFLDFDWRDVVPEDLQAEIDVSANTDSAKQEIEAIEADGGKMTVDVDANKKPADMAMGAWRAEQKDNTTTIPVDTDNSGVEQGVAEAEQAVENAVAEPMALDVDASMAIEKVVNTQKLINSMHGKTVTVNVKVNGLSNIQSAINKIAQVKDKTATVTTYSRTVNTRQVMADGTAHASGNWGTSRTERALTGELGPEIVVDPSTGRWYTVGDNGAEFVRIPKGSIVFNHKQTEALLRNGHVTGRGNALAEGTAYVSASGSFKKYSYSSSTSSSSSSSSSKTSGSSSYSSSNKSSSTTAKSTSNTELENWFERLYAYHQHLVAMEQESQESYIQWLTSAYKQAYNEGIITLEDYYKY